MAAISLGSADASARANGRILFKGRRMTGVTEHKTDPILTRQEVAGRLRISVRTLSRLEASGKLPPRIQISDRVFGYRYSSIERFLAERTGAAA
jgi:predicted DNA-binding transcriptional regulator AlpA